MDCVGWMVTCASGLVADTYNMVNWMVETTLEHLIDDLSSARFQVLHTPSRPIAAVLAVWVEIIKVQHGKPAPNNPLTYRQISGQAIFLPLTVTQLAEPGNNQTNTLAGASPNGIPLSVVQH